MSKNHLPTFCINVPNGGYQQTVTIGPNEPVYSQYTGNLIGYGPMNFGVPNDAPKGNPQYGGVYHVINKNPCNNSWIAHDPRRK